MTEQSYNADDMQVLEGLDSVRKRPGMYIGSTSSAGLNHLVWEIVDNSVDEALASYAKHITITLSADGSVTVTDDGRGIPTDVNTKVGLTGVEIAYTKLHGGGKFGGSGYKSAGGLHGVGASVVNALSTRTDVTVYRDGKEHKISFQRGISGRWSTNGIDGKFTAKKGLDAAPDKRSAAEKKARPTGTTVRWWEDRSIFLSDAVLDINAILTRARQTAFLVPGLSITVADLRDPAKELHESFQFDGGIVDMVTFLSAAKPLHDVISIEGTGNFTETVPVLDEQGHMVSTDVDREVEVKVAFVYNEGYDTEIRSFVNVVNTPNGGTHAKGFDAGLTKTIVEAVKSTRGLLKAKELPPVTDDVKEGLVAVVSVNVPEPQFIGQTKDELGTKAVQRVVQKIVSDQMAAWLAHRKNVNASKTIKEKVVGASRIRLAQREQKDVARKKNSLESSASMPAKLVHAASSNPDEIELMIAEGDSALGGLKQARDSNVTAIFPLRGKPLNAYDMNLGSVLKNQEWSDLIQIIGAGVGKEFNVENMNYSKIIILADGDADGSHIRALIISGMYHLMRPLIEHGKLYAALPPLFSITTSGRNPEKFFALNDEELPKLVASLKKKGKKWEKIVRHKGLGEYSSDILAEVVMDPHTRVLKQITLDDVQAFESTLELTMGKNAAGRRDWIVDNRTLIASQDIDA